MPAWRCPNPAHCRPKAARGAPRTPFSWPSSHGPSSCPPHSVPRQGPAHPAGDTDTPEAPGPPHPTLTCRPLAPPSERPLCTHRPGRPQGVASTPPHFLKITRSTSMANREVVITVRTETKPFDPGRSQNIEKRGWGDPRRAWTGRRREGRQA